MRYIYLYAIMLVLVVAIGCSKGGDVVSPSKTTSGQTATGAGSVADSSAANTVSYELTPEEESKATSFEQGKKTVISTGYKIMNVGDAYVFAIGIKNVIPKDTNFKIVPHFGGAKTTGGVATLIPEANEDVMLEWLGRNRFSIIKIGANGQTVVPLIVEVKSDIGPGKTIVPGSYNFDIDVMYESSSQFWDEYSAEVLAIKVK